MIPGTTSLPHRGAIDPPARRLGMDLITLILAMAGAFCCPMAWSVSAGYLSISDAFFLAALLTQARSGLRRLGELGGVPWMLLLSGALFGFSGLISYASGDMHAEPLNAAKLIFSMAVFPVLLMLTVGTDLRRLDWILLAWVAGGTLSAAVAIASRNGISLLGLYDQSGGSGGRSLGLSYHPNVLGYTCALIAPVAVYAVFHFPRWIVKTMALGSLAVLLYGLHLSGSRASFWALMLAAVYPVVRLLLGRRSALVLTVMVGMASAVALMLTIGGEFGSQMSAEFRESAIGRVLGFSTLVEGSNFERRLYIELAWAAFLENPFFGAGYGWLRGAHVHVLAILHSGGLLGFCAFLCWAMAIALACGRVVASLGKTSVAGYRELWPVIVAGLLIWMVNGALQPVLPDRNGYILVAALFSLDACARRVLSARPFRESQRRSNPAHARVGEL